jgi:hypothetical protein
MGEWIEQAVLERNANGQWILEEMFDILNHKGNANQNYTENQFYHSQNGYHHMIAIYSNAGEKGCFTMLVQM